MTLKTRLVADVLWLYIASGANAATEVEIVIAPFAPADRLRTYDRFNSLFEDLFNERDMFRRTWTPTVDIKETDKEFIVLAELPGMNEEDIEVEVVGDLLTIRGKREFSDEERRDDYIRVERHYGAFQRTFTLDVPVMAESVSAEYTDGILKVTVPKSERGLPKKITVRKG